MTIAVDVSSRCDLCGRIAQVYATGEAVRWCRRCIGLVLAPDCFECALNQPTGAGSCDQHRKRR